MLPAASVLVSMDSFYTAGRTFYDRTQPWDHWAWGGTRKECVSSFSWEKQTNQLLDEFGSKVLIIGYQMKGGREDSLSYKFQVVCLWNDRSEGESTSYFLKLVSCRWDTFIKAFFFLMCICFPVLLMRQRWRGRGKGERLRERLTFKADLTGGCMRGPESPSRVI